MYGLQTTLVMDFKATMILSSIALVQPCMANGVPDFSPVSDEATNGHIFPFLETEQRYEIEG